MKSRLKELRYRVMLALYLPILLYAFSTYDLSEDTYAVQDVRPVVIGEETVVLGQPFQAKALLAVGNTEGQRLFSDELEVMGDSAFHMPTGNLLAEDENEKAVSYQGRFRFQQVDGEETEIPVEGRFRVRRPEIVAQSEATTALYRQCLNRVRIDVPGLENRPLRLESGGRTVEGRSLALSPSGDESSVRVYLADAAGEDVYLGRKEFAVVDPPRPELRILNNGREIASGDNVPRARAVLEVGVEPDQEFRRRYPEDAGYRVERATVFLREGLSASREIGTFDLDGSRLVLTRALRDAQPGDRITVQLEGVYRINHAGEAIPVPFNEATRTFGFVLS